MSLLDKLKQGCQFRFAETILWGHQNFKDGAPQTAAMVISPEWGDVGSVGLPKR